MFNQQLFDSKILDGKQVAAVICYQWGDTGKGKISDLLASSWADVSARGTGGANAGHTIVVGGKKSVAHLLPSGITQDKMGKHTVIGSGVALDPVLLLQEINQHHVNGGSTNNLMISLSANIVFPYHKILDQRNSLAAGGIGTTGKGIGPCYSDSISRYGIQLRDLFNRDNLARKLRILSEVHSGVDINIEHLMEWIRPISEKLIPYARNTDLEMRKFLRSGKKIVLEGAQGILLSNIYGTRPFVTSSESSHIGTAQGVGLHPNDVDLVLGVVKWPFMTRVGAGPFPTELGGKESELYCAQGLINGMEAELARHGVPYEIVGNDVKYDSNHIAIRDLLNSSNPFEQGVGVRLAGWEYGATTKRPRRTGWTDLESLRHTLWVAGGHNVVLTKVDVLRGADEFKLGIGYEGKESSDIDFTDGHGLYKFKPVYRSFEGFSDDITDAKRLEELPETIRNAMRMTSQFTGSRIRMVSVGPDREQTIFT
jgi:adenylosuccinate synthase